MELIISKDAKDNKKGLFKCISRKRKTRENVCPLLNGHEITEMTEVPNVFHAAICTAKTSP